MTDNSEGWEAIAERFMRVRSPIGTALIRRWAQDRLAPSAAIIDIGCGSGVPIARALVGDGFRVSGIDASPTLIDAFRRNLPGSPAACECAQESSFFGRTFAGAILIGLVFLLKSEDQRQLLTRIADALAPSGRLLFTAPRESCEWYDTLTGRLSISLGEDAYAQHLNAAGLTIFCCLTDEGGNNYYDVMKSV